MMPDTPQVEIRRFSITRLKQSTHSVIYRDDNQVEIRRFSITRLKQLRDISDRMLWDIQSWN